VEKSEWPGAPVKDLRGRALPEEGWLAGYSALIERYDLALPLPPRLAFASTGHQPASTPEWLGVSVRRRPSDDLGGHLEFALKREGVDLSVLFALFRSIDPAEVTEFIRNTPTGKYARRIWFLYEWLTGEVLDLPDGPKVKAEPVVDPELQVASADGEICSRHRVVDNLPGPPAFCPMVRWTPALRAHVRGRWNDRAREVVGRTHPDVVSRAAAFLLLSDSRSSFQIEGERPGLDRIERWVTPTRPTAPPERLAASRHPVVLGSAFRSVPAADFTRKEQAAGGRRIEVRVRSGDSLADLTYRINRRYRTRLSLVHLQRTNRIRHAHLIHPGMRLRVQGKTQAFG